MRRRPTIVRVRRGRIIRRRRNNEGEEELSPKQKKYQAFFKKALKKFGVESPQELDKEKRKEFFDYVDKNYDAGENETD